MAKKKEKLSLEEMLEQAIVNDEDKPYEVPGNWVWSRLQNLVSILGDGLHGTPVYSENGEYYFINGNNLNNGFIDIKDNTKKVDLEEFLKYKKQLNDRTVFVSINGTLGNVAFYNDEKIILGKSACYFNLYENICKKYIMYIIKSEDFVNYANRVATGTTIKNVSLKSMRELNIPLPPSHEQYRIVDFIESMFEKLDTAKELVKNALDSFENRKAAILHKAFTGELTTKWREENGVSLEEWEEKYLGDIVTYSKEKYDPVIAENKAVYIGLEHIDKNGGIINKGDSDEVKSLKTVFRQGDILYGKLRPYLNKHDIVDFDGICSTDILVIRVKPNILNRYMNYMLNVSNFIDYAVSNSNGINLPRISEKEISKYKLKTPSIEEQKEIVSILDNLLDNEQRAKELYDVIEKIDLMKKAILSRAFRGELGTNDPEEESAVELLKEVLMEKI